MLSIFHASVALLLSSQQMIELSEPRTPELKTYSVEGRCGGNVYKFVYLTGTSLLKNYVSDVSVNGRSVHVRELAKLGTILQNRFDLQSIRLGRCNPNGNKPGIEFFVDTPRDLMRSITLESHRFVLERDQITRAVAR